MQTTMLRIAFIQHGNSVTRHQIIRRHNRIFDAFDMTPQVFSRTLTRFADAQGGVKLG